MNRRDVLGALAALARRRGLSDVRSTVRQAAARCVPILGLEALGIGLRVLKAFVASMHDQGRVLGKDYRLQERYAAGKVQRPADLADEGFAAPV